MKGGFKRLHGFGQKSLGFTIIEVMIVLAVTGLILFGAILLIAGRQNETEFQQAATTVTAQIQQVIDDVSNGYYPNSQDFNCTNSGGTVNLQSAAPGSGTTQGANADCIYLGKILPFNSAANFYNAYTLVGLRQPAPNGPVTTGFSTSADPTVLAQSVGGGQNFAPTDDFTNQLFENGLKVSKVTDPNGNSIGTVAFVTNSQGTYTSGTLSSGGSQVNLYTINNTLLTDSVATTITKIDTHPSYFNVVTPGVGTGNVKICFVSGTTKQSGLVTIGYGSGELQANLSIKNNTTCT